MGTHKGTKSDYVSDFQKPNYSGFVVIGAGLPRTGTMSLKEALGQLLDGACYHMSNVASGGEVDWDFWLRALDGKVSKRDWVDFLERRGFRAGVDYPIALFYRELMEAFPDAKVVLSVRNPETWYESVKNTIFRQQAMHRDFACRIFMWLNGVLGMSEVITKATGHVPRGMDKGIFDAIEAGREESVKFFNDWTEEVKRVVPEDRLLVFEAKQGWKPLCEFLDVPVPEGEFPRLNDTKQVQSMQTKIRAVSYLTVYVAPVVAGSILYFLLRCLSSVS